MLSDLDFFWPIMIYQKFGEWISLEMKFDYFDEIWLHVLCKLRVLTWDVGQTMILAVSYKKCKMKKCKICKK